jgi:hypothetical protein
VHTFYCRQAVDPLMIRLQYPLRQQADTQPSPAATAAQTLARLLLE